MILPFILLFYLVAIKYFTPFILIVLFAIPRLVQILPAFAKPKPQIRPANFPEGQGGWPLYFASLAFLYNRVFGVCFILGLVVDVLIRIFLPEFRR
jgi:1,4-dihydroxy-2-naphthoate polyprenyltransferase